MNLKNQSPDSPEWPKFYYSLYSYASDSLRRYYGAGTALLSKTAHDYVSEAILKHLTGEDGYDPGKGPLDFYLKKYIIKQSISNDARSQVPALNLKKGLGLTENEKGFGRFVEATVDPMAEDDDKMIRSMIESEIAGDDVVEQIYLAVYHEGFGIKDRAEICATFGMEYRDFDNGTRRFKDVLRKVYLKEI